MGKGRLEAFSDGVLAIIITIMVLGLQLPRGDSLADLIPILPVMLSYALSFVYVGIFWNNHHHLLLLCRRVGAGEMWANMHLLFWLSLVPYATAWVGAYGSAAAPAAFYGSVLAMCGCAYFLLQRQVLAGIEDRLRLASTFGGDLKGRASVPLYVLGIGLAYLSPLLSYGIYAAVALLWIVPDRRLERLMGQGEA